MLCPFTACRARSCMSLVRSTSDTTDSSLHSFSIAVIKQSSHTSKPDTGKDCNACPIESLSSSTTSISPLCSGQNTLRCLFLSFALAASGPLSFSVLASLSKRPSTARENKRASNIFLHFARALFLVASFFRISSSLCFSSSPSPSSSSFSSSSKSSSRSALLMFFLSSFCTFLYIHVTAPCSCQQFLHVGVIVNFRTASSCRRKQFSSHLLMPCFSSSASWKSTFISTPSSLVIRSRIACFTTWPASGESLLSLDIPAFQLS
mmetsp:Transcript_52369/g.122592  ORF Transcript_52369/g.122592 Transcript_52369/m.122592 type:complete len:263 (-) Transcript_52369:2159-2947(-)